MRDEPFSFTIHRDYTARLFPWWGTMGHGIGVVGGPGEGVWRARSREKLIRKMERSATKIHRRWGNVSEPRFKIRNDYQE